MRKKLSVMLIAVLATTLCLTMAFGITAFAEGEEPSGMPETPAETVVEQGCAAPAGGSAPESAQADNAPQAAAPAQEAPAPVQEAPAPAQEAAAPAQEAPAPVQEAAPAQESPQAEQTAPASEPPTEEAQMNAQEPGQAPAQEECATDEEAPTQPADAAPETESTQADDGEPADTQQEPENPAGEAPAETPAAEAAEETAQTPAAEDTASNPEETVNEPSPLPGAPAPAAEAPAALPEATAPALQANENSVCYAAQFYGVDDRVVTLSAGEEAELNEFVRSLGYEGKIESAVSSNPDALAINDGRICISSRFVDETLTLVINGQTVTIRVHDPEKVTASTIFDKFITTGEYYLDEDITIPNGTLYVHPDAVVTLDLNGHVLKGTGSGSVITVNGTFTLKDSAPSATHTDTTLPAGGVITGGNSTGNGGGVNVASGATFTMTGGTISGNTAETGGGVYVNNGTFTISGSASVSGNTATTSGGGVHVRNGNLTMSGGTISGNIVTSSTGGGGGGVCIYTTSNNSYTIEMTGGTISDNTAKLGGGGGVYIYAGNSSASRPFVMTGGTISGNTAKLGGGMYVGSNGMFTMTGGTITGNIATSKAGGVYDNNTVTLGGTAKITGNVKDNTANNLYLYKGKTVTISTSTVPEANMTIGVTTETKPDESTLVAVTGTNSTDYHSNFFSDDINYLTVNDSNIVKLTLAKAYNTNTEVSYSTVQEAADAAASGQTVQMLRDSQENVTVAASKSITLDLNGKVLKGTGSGSVITINGSLTLKDSAPDATHTDTTLPAGGIITGGNAVRGGGVYSNGTFIMDSGSITGNTASNDGGGVYADEGGSFTMNGGKISNNTAAANGGGVLVKGQYSTGTFTMNGGEISGNKANGSSTSEGGGVCAIYSEAVFTMTGGKITGNTATNAGGGVRVYQGTVNMTGGEISGNTANAGGGVYVDKGGTFNLSKDGTISDNTANGTTAYNGGGGVYVESGSLKMSGGTISGNKVTNTGRYVNGGGVYVKSGEFTMKDGSISGNEAFQSGGGIHLLNSTMSMSGGTIESNKCVITGKAWGGGGICVNGENGTSTFTMTGGTISKNTAGSCGGGVDVCNGTFTLNGGTVTGNTATGNGGGVYVGNGSFSMEGGTVSDNKAANGGGVYNASTMTVSGGEISGNKATTSSVSMGGGVYNAGTLSMSAGKISGNEATSYGGGVYNHQNFTMTGGTISGNTAETGGGVDSNWNGSTTLTGGSITGNTASTGGGVAVQKDDGVTLGGTVQITGNTANNLYLPSGMTVAISTTTAPASGMNVGVYTQATPAASAPVDITAASSGDYHSYFTSDRAGYGPVNSGSGSSQIVQLRGHEHSWTYAADGASITATCEDTVGTCNVTDTTLTVTASSATYDGKAHTATFTQTSFIGSSTLPGITYAVKNATGGYDALTDAPKDAGTYRASFTVGEGTDAKTAFVEYTISPKQLTVSGTTVADKAYDGTTTAAVTAAGTLSGVASGETVTLSATATYADKNAGTGKAVTIVYTISGDDAANYLAPATDSTSFTADITAKQLTVSGSSVEASKTYDGTTTATVTAAGTLSGVVSGETVTLSATATYADKNAGTGKAVTVIYTISGDDAANYLAPATDSTSFTADITAKQLTVSGSSVEASKAYDGTTTAAVTAVGTLSGVASGETVTLSAEATYADKDAGTGKAVTIVYTISGDDAANYLAPATDSTSLTADITAKQLTVSGSSASGKTYDGTTAATATAGTVTGIAAGDDVTLSIASASFDTADAGTGKAVTIVYALSGADAANYAVPENDVVYADITKPEEPTPAPAATEAAEPARSPVGTTDDDANAVMQMSGSTAKIQVENRDGETVDPVNVTILEPATLLAMGAKTAEIRMTENLTVILDIEAAMCGKTSCVITIDNNDGIITVACDGERICMADFTDIAESIATLVYDGKTLKAFDAQGNLIKEFEIG